MSEGVNASRDSAPPALDTAMPSEGARRSAAPLTGFRRLLVLLPSWVGDITMATPLLRALRAARPEVRIAVLSRPGLGAILDGAPWIDERFEAPMRGVAGPWTGLGAARGFAADAVLLLPHSLRAGLAAMRLARRRFGYATQLRRWTLTDPCEPPVRRQPLSEVDSYAQLGEWALGTPIDDRRPELFVTDEENREAARLLEGLERFVLINPGANRRDKRWPVDRFAVAAREIAREHALGIAVTGSRAERELARDFAAHVTANGGTAAPRVVDLVERGISLGSLKGVLRRAALLLTNDTGPRHLAAALGTPSIVLFGPTDHRWTTLPESTPRRDRLLLAEPFLPDELAADNYVDHCRIERIAVGDVVDSARLALAPRAP